MQGEWKQGSNGIEEGKRYDVMCSCNEMLNNVLCKAFLNKDGAFIFSSGKGREFIKKTSDIEKYREHKEIISGQIITQ